MLSGLSRVRQINLDDTHVFCRSDQIASEVTRALRSATFGGDDGLISSALFASFRAHNQVSAGVRWREFSFWMSEDYTPGSNPRSVITFVYVSNSPDIVAGLSWTKQF